MLITSMTVTQCFWSHKLKSSTAPCITWPPVPPVTVFQPLLHIWHFVCMKTICIIVYMINKIVQKSDSGIILIKHLVIAFWPCGVDIGVVWNTHVRAWLETKLGTSSSPSGLEAENSADVSKLGNFHIQWAWLKLSTTLNWAPQQPASSPHLPPPAELSDACHTPPCQSDSSSCSLSEPIELTALCVISN